jgi:ATP-dependent DNA helicase RecG
VKLCFLIPLINFIFQFYAGDIRNTYMRQGGGDYKCSQEEIQRMLREASEYSSDSMILDGFDLDDIDPETVQCYKQFLSVRSAESPFIILSQEELLFKLGCVSKVRNSDEVHLTMGGLLLFGREESIQRRFPGYEFDIYLIRNRNRDVLEFRWDDRKIYETNLIQTYLQGMEYIKSKIEIPFALADDHMTRTEDVPMVIALREAFVNMLIHRDYFDKAQSRIKIFPDLIEMYNPGSAPKPVEEIIANEVTAPHNPIIAKAFRLAGWAEIAGSGMMKIFAAWEKLRYKKPEIENNNRGYYFKMVFPIEKSPKNSAVSPDTIKYRSSTDQVPIKYRTRSDQVEYP